MRTDMMKSLKFIALLLVAFGSPAVAQTGIAKPKATLSAEIGTCFPDQNVGAITPAVLRACMQDFLASWQQYAGVNPQVGTTYTIQASDYGQLVTTNNGSSVAVTLPAASSAGFTVFSTFIQNLGAGAATITPAAGLINGAANFVLNQGQGVFIISDATNWQVFKAGGTGTLNTVSLVMPGCFSVSGSPASGASGTFTVTMNGTSGGIPYYSSASTCASSPALAANTVVVGGGAGSSPFTPSTNPPIINPSTGALTVQSTTASTTSGTGALLVSGGVGITGALNIGGNFAFGGTLSPTSLGASPGTITGLTLNNSPSGSNDYFLYYNAASGTIQKCTIASCSSAATAGVSSLNGLTGGLSVVQGVGISVSASLTSITVGLTTARQTLPTVQTFITGTAQTYTTPPNVLWLEVNVCGGGGGGSGANSGTTAVAGTGGVNSSFNSIVANAGGGGGASGAAGTAPLGGVGGTGGSGTATRRMTGHAGQSGQNSATAAIAASGAGGGSVLLGGGGQGRNTTGVGNAGQTNTGSGGGGAYNTSGADNIAGGGGGAGECFYLIINGPAGSYTYTVGTGGAGGVATSNGGAGADGYIQVIEHYGS